MDVLNVEPTLVVYVVSAMVITFVLHYFVSKAHKKTKWNRITESFVCQLLTISFSLPLLEFFPNMPDSIVLIVAVVIGVLGVEGWENIAHGIISLIFQHVTGYRFHFTHRDSYEIDEESEEPPLPIKRRNNESK